MTDGSAAPVVIPAGPLLEQAARWLGGACWLELRLHAVLTTWLADEPDDPATLTWWTHRSARALTARECHDRLPELRETPRHEFVAAGREEVAALLDRMEALPGGMGAERAGALAAVLAAVAEGYRARLRVAVGPADGPTASTLRTALDRLDAELAAVGERSSAWSEAIREAGGLP